jgi:ERCC4-type nuclease
MYVDVRERDLIPLLSAAPQHEAKQLPVGDIWIGLSGEQIQAGGLVIERKRTDDLEASILDGRYREQRTRLLSYCQQTKGRPVYIIEGLLDRFHARLSEKALLKHITRLSIRYGVAVFQTASLQETARLCLLFQEQLAEDSRVFELQGGEAVAYSSTIQVTRKGNREDPAIFASAVLQQVPGVSHAIASAILEKAGGHFQGVWNLPEKELAAIQVSEKRKVGPAIAKRLWSLFHGT